MRVKLYVAIEEKLLEFEDEIEDFRMTVKAPEQYLFNVTMPTVSATLTLASTDTNLEDVRHGDTMEFINSGDVSVFTLFVVSATIMIDRGITEIVCSGMPLKKLKTGTGTFSLTKTMLESNFGNDVIMDDINIRDVEFIIDKKEDLIMSYAWADKSRLLFVSPAYHLFERGFGGRDWMIGYEGGMYLPEYIIEPKDIISYDISPPAPPITDLEIEYAPEDLDATVINDIDQYSPVRSYFMSGIDLFAYYYELDGNGFLKWSDGRLNTFNGTKRIVGIFTDSYVEMEVLGYNATLKKIDRNSNSLLGSVGLNNYMEYMAIGSDMQAPFITYYETEGKQTLYFKRTHVDTDNPTGVNNNMKLIFHYGTYDPLHSGNWNLIDVQKGNAYYFRWDNIEERMYIVVINTREVRHIFEKQLDMFYIGTPSNVRVVGIKAKPNVPEVTILVRSNYGPDIVTWIVNMIDNSYPIFTEGETRFMGDPAKDELHELRIVTVQHQPEPPMPTAVYSLNGTIITETTDTLFSERFKLKYATQISEAMLYRNKAILITDVNENRNIYVVRNSVPWSCLKKHEETILINLQEGENNVVRLPYLTTRLGTYDIPKEETGRIEMEIATFQEHYAGWGSMEATIQNLHIPALMSIVNVTTSEGALPRRMRITGIDIGYRGIITMILTGILID